MKARDSNCSSVVINNYRELFSRWNLVISWIINNSLHRRHIKASGNLSACISSSQKRVKTTQLSSLHLRHKRRRIAGFFHKISSNIELLIRLELSGG